MNFASIIVILTIALMIFGLVKNAMRPGLILFSAAVLLMMLGIISPEEMTSGFSNKGVITVAVLFLVSEGVKMSGALNKIASLVLPTKHYTTPRLLLTIMLPISALSAFLNNTPVVIIFAPMIKRWAEKLNLAPSKFLIPLSYATIFGGMCTLIGTSTNLVVNGMMQSNGYKGLEMFELAKVGFFVAMFGSLYVAFVGHRLLNGKKKLLNPNKAADTKEYYFNLRVKPGSNCLGEIIRNSKLANHKELTIVAVERDGIMLSTKNERVVLQENDTLLIYGFDEHMEKMLVLDGLELMAQGNLESAMRKDDIERIEVVLAPRFPGIGRTLEEFDFYQKFKGIVVAIHRNGSNITSGLNKVKLQTGDSLIILANNEFIESWGESKVFFLISSKGELEKPVKTYKIGWTITIVLLMILGATFGKYLPTVKGNSPDMFFFASVAAVLMAALKIFPPKRYARAISWDVLVTIASAFAISHALANSGAAQWIAQTAIDSVKHMGPIAVLAIIYLMTMFCTEIITNNAAAALSFPIAMSAAQQLGVDPKPFFIAICIAASASFSTPIGYQTNLIVQAIGNYKFSDYLRVGIPLNLITFIISMIIIPLVWKF